MNCFGDYYFWDRGLNGGELLLFAIISLFIVSILLWYYNKIPKNKFKEGDFQQERKTSRLPKLLAYLLLIIPGIILLVEFLNYGNTFSTFDIIMLSSITTLILYTNLTSKIKKVTKRSNLNNPIYQSKDIILQSNSLNASFIIAEKTTSVWIKVITFIMIIVISFTPLYQLLGTGYFW